MQETPDSKKFNGPIEDNLKVLDAAERQIQHWILQLSGFFFLFLTNYLQEIEILNK